jgi:hypothetical protein
MQLSTQYGFAFLCAPKCASSSIESVIAPYCNVNFSGPGGLKHITARDYRDTIYRYHRRALSQRPIEAFSIFREPVEWLFSWYRYRQRDDIKQPDHPFHRNYTGNMSFEDFVDGYLREEQRPTFANVGDQARFHTLKGGQIGVERIYGMHRLDQVAAYLSERLGVVIELPVKNKAPEMAMTLSASKATALKQTLAQDYAIWQRILDADGVLVSTVEDE